MVPVGRGVQREYQDMMRGFTCCVAAAWRATVCTATEFITNRATSCGLIFMRPRPRTGNPRVSGLSWTMTFPEGDAATLKLTVQKAKHFTLALRRPSWAGAGFSVKVNGTAVKDVSKPGSYVELKRTWKNGDTVTLVLPKTLRVEPTPDTPGRVALMWGPLVLAGDLGPERDRRGGGGSTIGPIPSFVSEAASTDWLKPVADKPGNFHAAGRDNDDQTREIDLVPFYRLQRRTYAIYWDPIRPAPGTKAGGRPRNESGCASRSRDHQLTSAGRYE